MGNWFSMEGLERGMRNKFLINKESTAIEIYRMKDIFSKIEEKVASTESLLEELKTSRSGRCTRNRIRKETTYLLAIYESLQKTVDCHNEEGTDQFDLKVVTIKGKVENTLREIAKLFP